MHLLQVGHVVERGQTVTKLLHLVQAQLVMALMDSVDHRDILGLALDVLELVLEVVLDMERVAGLPVNWNHDWPS